jgi:transposase
MKAYSKEFRERVIAAKERGEAPLSIAKRLEVSFNWVYSLLRRYLTTGSYEALPNNAGAKPKLSESDLEILRQTVRDHPDATLEELKELTGFTVSKATLCRALKKLKLSFKKKTFNASEQKRPDVEEAREVWKEEKATEDAAKFVFLDESSINTGFSRLYGRAPVGERLFDYAPDCRWKTLTVLSSLRLDGTTEALVFEGALNGEMFKGYIEECLAPSLKEGDIVIMDNLSSHKVEGLEKIVEEKGARIVYLPPYSPDLNPVENMWSKIKNQLRKQKERCKEILIEAVGTALRTITAQDAQGWFGHCGYCV